MKKRVTLTFPQSSVHRPVTYQLVKDYNIASSIIRAQVAPNQMGTLVLELLGDIDAIEAAIEWMRSENIHVSLINTEIQVDWDSCVDCGLCTGVCPTTALSLDRDFSLKFRSNLCIVCEQCIPTCPLQAISTNL
ncbi:MAG: 4Fe-4S binding protein [Synechococcaceae cyanobacterium RL_1_2]|nr:4Fe-4S binding protein [Synechococcaceae cyanobacterium RL_1_2]